MDQLISDSLILTRQLPEQSFVYIALRFWVPPIITVAFGGLFASIIFPRWQDRYFRQKHMGDRRQALRENIAEHFDAYVVSWRRLIDIAKYERSIVEKRLDPTEAQRRKTLFVERRGEKRDALMAELARYRIYASVSELQLIDEFVSWDEEQATKRLTELPSPDEWRSWEMRVLAHLHSNPRQNYLNAAFAKEHR